MEKMKDYGLLDCEDRPSIEENFKRVVKNGTGGGSGGGADVLNENGKLKNEVLPEGYPYETVEEFSVDVTADVPTPLENFPKFAVGDTVKLKVDGVEYSLIAFDDNGNATIGDTFGEFYTGMGAYGWLIMSGSTAYTCFAKAAHNLSWKTNVAIPFDVKFMHKPLVVRTEKDENEIPYITMEDVEKIKDAFLNGIPVRLRTNKRSFGIDMNVDYVNDSFIYATHFSEDAYGVMQQIAYEFSVSNGTLHCSAISYLGSVTESGNNYPLMFINNRYYKITVSSDGVLQATEYTG